MENAWTTSLARYQTGNGRKTSDCCLQVLPAHKPQEREQNGGAWGSGPRPREETWHLLQVFWAVWLPYTHNPTTSPEFYQDVSHFGKQLLKSQVLLEAFKDDSEKSSITFSGFALTRRWNASVFLHFLVFFFNAMSSWGFWFVSCFLQESFQEEINEGFSSRPVLGALHHLGETQSGRLHPYRRNVLDSTWR